MVGNKFTVAIGPINISFSKVRNISKDIQFEVLQEGGVNDHAHILQKPYTSPHKLIFEKGVSDTSTLSKLTPLLVGKKLPYYGTITIKNSMGETAGSYSFTEPIILKWSIGELDALGNKVLIESLEIAHSGITISDLGALGKLLSL